MTAARRKAGSGGRLAAGLAALALLAGCGGMGGGILGGFGLGRVAAPDPAGTGLTDGAPEPEIEVRMAMSDTPRPVARPGSEGAAAPASVRSVPPRPPAGARTAEALDTTSPEDRASALARASGGQALGETVASLGSPADPGFWLRTPLVTAPRPGRVAVAGGGSVAVELRPSGGAVGSGSQLSLPAFRALGVPLTALPVLQVFSD